MVQILPTKANIFGRLGQGLGQGLADQIPKEVEHYRRSEGLKEAGKQSSGDLYQDFANLASVYGITPQMLETGGNLLKQRAQGQALMQEKQQQPNPFPAEKPIAGAKPSEVPSITRADLLADVQKGFIEPDIDEIQRRAGRRYAENSALYKNDPNKAIEAEEKQIEIDRQNFLNKEKQNERLQNIHDKTVERLRKHTENLKTEIPENLYSKLENEAIDAVIPKELGGGGLTEDQAVKEIGEKIDAASRDYSNLRSLGTLSILDKKPEKVRTSLKTLQQNAKERNDSENMADTAVTELGLTNGMSYSIFEPTREVNGLNKFIQSLPKLKGPSFVGTFQSAPASYEKNIQKQETLKIAKQLSSFVKDNEEASPLAIGFEIEKLGYDPDVWIKYLSDNRKDLNLKESQIRQLSKNEGVFDKLNDWLLESFSGLD